MQTMQDDVVVVDFAKQVQAIMKQHIWWYFIIGSFKEKKILLPRGQMMYSLRSELTILSFSIPLRLGRVNHTSTQAKLGGRGG